MFISSPSKEKRPRVLRDVETPRKQIIDTFAHHHHATSNCRHGSWSRGNTKRPSRKAKANLCGCGGTCDNRTAANHAASNEGPSENWNIHRVELRNRGELRSRLSQGTAIVAGWHSRRSLRVEGEPCVIG